MEDLIAYLKEEIATAPGECFVISKKQAKQVIEKIDRRKFKISFSFIEHADQVSNFIIEKDIVSICYSGFGGYVIFYKSYE